MGFAKIDDFNRLCLFIEFHFLWLNIFNELIFKVEELSDVHLLLIVKNDTPFGRNIIFWSQVFWILAYFLPIYRKRLKIHKFDDL